MRTSGQTVELSDYSRVHRHFLTGWLPPLLGRLAAAHPPEVLVDLGSGDGPMIWALREAGLATGRVYAVDLSPERVAAAAAIDDGVVGIVSDATRVPELPDGCADAVICSQVIEHVPDDRALAPELARLLRPGGWWYVGSVLRGPRAWWIYRRDGRWWLDPTHVREYPTRDAFCAALRHPELELEVLRTEPFRFPVVDLALRAVARTGLIGPERLSTFYTGRRRSLERMRDLRVRIPDYRLIEAGGRRRSPPDGSS